MTDYEAAAERLRTKWTATSKVCDDNLRLKMDFISDMAEVTDMHFRWLDPSPITEDPLRRLGAEQDGNAFYFTSKNGEATSLMCRRDYIDGITFVFRLGDSWINPQPRHMGDLCWLLWRLGIETKGEA